MHLIYCADGNKQFAKIAIEAGFRYGARLPARGLHHKIFFADHDWKQPNRERYMSELEKHKPTLATVLDWERDEQLPEILAWAEDAAQYVEHVLIVPKISGGIKRLPRQIGGKSIFLAYSVPTHYGATPVPAWEFIDWPVHLLGGAPHKQLELAYYLNVVSVDGNMHQMMAVKFCAIYEANPRRYKRGHWPTLKETTGYNWENDAHYEAFRRSCKNIIEMWATHFH